MTGLSAAEAAARLRTVGENRLAEPPRWRRAVELARTLADPMALMLAGAAVVYLLLGERRDALLMALALVPVLGVDVLLEARSRRALAKLAAAVAAPARVVRDGVEREVPAAEVVPGDRLLLREGDVVHADGVVRAAANLAVDEAALTGEAEPQPKRAGAGATDEERVFAGSRVVAGQGACDVEATGRRTRYGAIARLVAEASAAPTPLQERTGRFVRKLAVGGLAAALVLAALTAARGASLGAALLSGISLAMAAVPEEFPLVFTLFLSLGAWRLARRGVLARRLAAVEALGSTTVLCLDKTGTLTAGEFALAEAVPLDGVDEPRLLAAAVLACEASPADPIERAIVAGAERRGVGPPRELRLVADYDFDPIGKHMSHAWSDGARGLVVAKGALEGVLAHCAADDGERAAAEAANARLAGRGLRVLAVAERDGGPPTGRRDDDERALRLLGLLAFQDPLRPEARAAVDACRKAGIAVKLVTGDHALTAQAIAEDAGIAPPGAAVVTGDELADLDGEAFAERVRAARVIARVRPEQKHAVVAALDAGGETVAMTGDGINDAPALRRAAIGVSMGAHATAVAREAADLVLLDDSLTAMVDAVRQGRRVYANLQRAFLFLIAFHVPIVGLALAAPLAGLPLLLAPLHLVWLELIVHPVSALVFEGEPEPADLMARPPRPRAAPLLARAPLGRALVSGALVTVAALALFAARLPLGEERARAAALVVVIVGGVLLAWAETGRLVPRSARFWIICAAAAATLPLAFFFAPAARALAVVPPTARDWVVAIALAVAAVSWRGLLPRRWGAGTGTG